MAYYVRKIARAKWRCLEDQAERIIENYKADTIANDLRTTDNKLSIWKAESLSDQDIEPVIVINSLLGEKISAIDLLFIPEEFITDFPREQVDGKTIVTNYASLHYNITGLTVKRHILFAKDVVLNILKKEEETEKAEENGTISDNENNQHLIQKISFDDQCNLINKWINLNEVKFEEMTEKQQKNLSDWRNKRLQA